MIKEKRKRLLLLLLLRNEGMENVLLLCMMGEEVGNV